MAQVTEQHLVSSHCAIQTMVKIPASSGMESDHSSERSSAEHAEVSDAARREAEIISNCEGRTLLDGDKVHILDAKYECAW
jgi:hypothetical protein